VTWPIQTLCTLRGEYTLGPLRVVAGDPFGLFDIERKVGAVTPIVVYPATVTLEHFGDLTGQLPGGEAVRRRTHQITTNASGIREYQPGDSFNRVHWPTSARKDRLMVKEFELDPLTDIWIVIDEDQTVHAGEVNPYALSGGGASPIILPPSTEEYAIAAGASLVQHFLEKDRSVGLAISGRRHERIQVDRGARQLTRFLELLAVAAQGSSLPFDQLLTLEGDQLSRGTTVIAVTPSTRESWVEAAARLLRRGLRVISVLVDPVDFGGRAGIRHTAARLDALRIPNVVVRRGDNLGEVLSSIDLRNGR
jgi:uncharacterized protein (DUF58 family)